LKIKILLFIFCFSFVSFSQRNLDSIAKANVKAICYSQDSLTYFSTNPNLRLKLTVSARINDNINFSNPNELTIHDYLSLGVYDIRLRFYVTHHIKVFQRMLITGFDRTNYFFTTGVVLKF
jgi:hypothetical protein